MTSDWLAELQSLAFRYPHLGITADLEYLSIADAYALLTWLRRITSE